MKFKMKSKFKFKSNLKLDLTDNEVFAKQKYNLYKTFKKNWKYLNLN